MKPPATKRYIYRDVRKGRYGGLRNTIAAPWQVIDTHTGKVIDEYASGNAARSHAAELNRTNPTAATKRPRRLTVPNPTSPGALRPVELISDRAKRYRSRTAAPPNPGHCQYCGKGSKRLDLEHMDGNEANTNPSNLCWACRACNTSKGNSYRRTGRGVPTVRANPRKKASGSDFKAYLGDMMIARGFKEGDQDAAWARIMARPASVRSQYAADLWQMRKRRGTTQTGRQSEIPF